MQTTIESYTVPAGQSGAPATPQQAQYFWTFAFKQKSLYWKIALPALLLQFIVFKWMYPAPDFISDSYSYIETAINHMDVNLWPVGYARILAFIHLFTSSDLAVIACQFFFLEAALLAFFYSFIYFYKPARNTTAILFIFLFFNPMLIWLSNALLSDAIFNGLSLLWWTQFIWMLYRPRRYQIFVLAGLLGICFIIRYTAMYYPLVAAVAYLMSRHKLLWKWTGIVLGVVVMIPFILFTRQKTKELTGTAEFSVFGGWQIANNALYMYDHIQVDSNQLPPETREIDRLVRAYFKRVPPAYRDFGPFPGTFFIKVPDAPLKMYSYPHFKSYDAIGSFKAWGAVSSIYNKYGTWLINHYPFSFARYYLWLNAKNYFVPHMEIFNIYNYGSDSVWPVAVNWFEWKSPFVKAASLEALPSTTFYIYPAVFMILNIYLLVMIVWLIATGKWRRMPPFFMYSIWLLIAYVVVNFGFSIFATPVVLRYQVLPFILLFAYSLALFEFSDGSRANA